MSEQLVVLILQLAIKYGPGLAQDITEIMHKDAPTLADWQAVFGKMKTYEQYVAPK